MKFVLLLLLWLASIQLSYAQGNVRTATKPQPVKKDLKSSLVYICTSKASYAYHNSECRGMKNCKADKDTISLSEALAIQRKACGFCYKK